MNGIKQTDPARRGDKCNSAIRQRCLAYLVAGVLSGSACSVQATIFANRQNVDILNSDAVILTGNTTPPQSLVGYIDENGFWEGFGTTANIVANLGQVQDVKTIKMRQAAGGTGLPIPDMIFETATSAGGPWTVVPATVTRPATPGATEADFALSSAVDTQFLRVRKDDTSGTAGDRWVLQALRFYGDSGASLASGNHQDVIANAGGLVTTISTSGGSLFGDFTDDNEALLSRRVLYNMGAGDSATIGFNQSIRMGTFGWFPEGGFRDAGAAFHFQLWGSTNSGATFTSLLLDRTGPEPAAPTFYNIGDFTGTTLRLDIVATSAGQTDLRFSDFFVMEAVPEPSTLLLLAVGGLVVRRRFRARRTQR